ncbi:response regulator transcription factor, partial [bacterium]|nr:response regulator transcription factor [bacterium]
RTLNMVTHRGGGWKFQSVEVQRMKDLTREETLEVLGACLELLANREAEIRQLYDRLQTYEPELASEGKFLGAITPDVDEENRKASSGWPTAVAVCGTPLVGRSLMLLCPQVGLRIVGITDSGIEGLKLVEKYKPEMVFVDLDVNDIDGLVLVSRIRDVLPEIVVVALAGGSHENTLVSAIIAGADEVVSKPMQAKRMINAIKRLLNIKRPKTLPDQRLPLHINPLVSGNNKRWSVLNGNP